MASARQQRMYQCPRARRAYAHILGSPCVCATQTKYKHLWARDSNQSQTGSAHTQWGAQPAERAHTYQTEKVTFGRASTVTMEDVVQ